MIYSFIQAIWFRTWIGITGRNKTEIKLSGSILKYDLKFVSVASEPATIRYRSNKSAGKGRHRTNINKRCLHDWRDNI